MNEVIEFDNIEQIEELGCELEHYKVTLTNKKGKQVTFNVKELEPEQFFECQSMASDFQVEDGEVKADAKTQLKASIQMFSMCLVNKKGERIGNSEKTVEFLRKSFDILELTKGIHKTIDVSGLSKKQHEQFEKN